MVKIASPVRIHITSPKAVIANEAHIEQSNLQVRQISTDGSTASTRATPVITIQRTCQLLDHVLVEGARADGIGSSAGSVHDVEGPDHGLAKPNAIG
jgi:hypothetical protein